jgi:hypothetical protein
LEDPLKRARIRDLLGFCFVAACLLSACKRADGDSCQAPSDCDDGLMCCITESSVRGTCLADCSQTMGSSSSDDDAGSSD